MPLHPVSRPAVETEEVLITPSGLSGLLALPAGARGIVLFAHGSGSSRFSERNQYVARVLQQAGLGTLLFDLLTEDEADDRRKVFDIPRLAERLQEATDWLKSRSETAGLNIGYFGASTGAAAALVAAARTPEQILAVVSRGGRPDLAGGLLPRVEAPTLLIVGGDDGAVLELNEQALAALRCGKRLAVVPGATHLFPEPGALEEVARLAQEWFVTHLTVNEVPHEETSAADVKSLPYGRPFRDRVDAGQQLARRFRDRELRDPLVLGIPRGGIVVGAALARELNAELDIVLSRKLRAPYQSELAIGAVGEDGSVYLTPEASACPGVSETYIAAERSYQMHEIHRRRRLFRGVRPAAPITGRSVILVDDGIATGSTAICALEVIRAQDPYELIVAAPVGPPRRLEEIRSRCDELVVLYAPDEFWAIGQFYVNFEQVEDEEVAQLLRQFAPATA